MFFSRNKVLIDVPKVFDHMDHIHFYAMVLMTFGKHLDLSYFIHNDDMKM